MVSLRPACRHSMDTLQTCLEKIEFGKGRREDGGRRRGDVEVGGGGEEEGVDLQFPVSGKNTTFKDCNRGNQRNDNIAIEAMTMYCAAEKVLWFNSPESCK